MNSCIDRIDDDYEYDGERDRDRDLELEYAETESTTTRRRRIDVTDLHAAGVQEFVRDSVRTDNVSLEHRGARTFLVVED